MDNTLLYTFKRFSGINNVDELHRLPSKQDQVGYTYSDMAVMQNIDISNQFALSTRQGSDLKLAGTDMHSLWSDGSVGLFVDYDSLYRLLDDYTSALLLSGLNIAARMSYASVADRVYLTNGYIIRYYKDSQIYSIPVPTAGYKLPLPAGQYILYYKGRLYVASGKILYIADALCDHYDIRTGYRVFKNDITILAATDSGIYVADGSTWYMQGEAPEDFKIVKVLDVDAVPNTAITVKGDYFDDEVADGNVVIWTSTEGICMGNNSGKVRFLSQDRYVLNGNRSGSAALRKMDGQNHYIVTLEG